jgi:hypothetical protein
MDTTKRLATVWCSETHVGGVLDDRECWQDDPQLRPSFAEIVERITRHLGQNDDDINFNLNTTPFGFCASSGSSISHLPSFGSSFALPTVPSTTSLHTLATPSSTAVASTPVASAASSISRDSRPQLGGAKTRNTRKKEADGDAVKKPHDEGSKMFVWKDTIRRAPNPSVQCFLRIDNQV